MEEPSKKPLNYTCTCTNQARKDDEKEDAKGMRTKEHKTKQDTPRELELTRAGTYEQRGVYSV